MGRDHYCTSASDKKKRNNRHLSAGRSNIKQREYHTNALSIEKEERGDTRIKKKHMSSANSSGFIVSATPPKSPEAFGSGHGGSSMSLQQQQHQHQLPPVAPFSSTSGLPLPTQPLAPEAIQLLQRMRAFRQEMNQGIDNQLRLISESRAHAMARLTAMRQTILQRTAPADMQQQAAAPPQQQQPSQRDSWGQQPQPQLQHQRQYGNLQQHHHHHHQQDHQHQQQQNVNDDWTAAASSLATPPITPSKHRNAYGHNNSNNNQQHHSGGNETCREDELNEMSLSSTGMLGSPAQKGTVGLETLLSAFGPPSDTGGYSLFAPPPVRPNLDALLAGAAAAAADSERERMMSNAASAGGNSGEKKKRDANNNSNNFNKSDDTSPTHEALINSIFRDQDNAHSIERYRERRAAQQSFPDDADVLLPRNSGGGGGNSSSSSSNLDHQQVFLQQQQQARETARPLDFGNNRGNNNNNNRGGFAGDSNSMLTPMTPPTATTSTATSDESLRTISVERLVKLYGHRTVEHRVLSCVKDGRPVVDVMPNTTPDTALSLAGIDVAESQLPCQTIVQFKNGRQMQVPFPFFVAPGQYVFVDVDRGTDLGLCIFAATSVSNLVSPQCDANSNTNNNNNKNGNKQLLAGLRNARLGKVVGIGGAQSRGIGIASDMDVAQWRALGDLEQKAVISANRLALDHRVALSFMDAEYQFDRSKLTIFYPRETAKTDFRELVRAMYKSFRARIWLEAMPEGATSSLPIAAASSTHGGGGSNSSPGDKQQQYHQ